MACDLARQPQAGGQRVDVVACLQEIEADRRRRQRVGAFQLDRAARLGPEVHRADREAGKRMRHGAHAVAVGKAPDAEIELDIGAVESRVAARETAGANAVAGQRPFLEQHVLHTRDQLFDRAVGDVVQGHRLGAAERQPHIEMVLQIGADRRQVAHHRNAVLLQHLGRSEPR